MTAVTEPIPMQRPRGLAFLTFFALFCGLVALVLSAQAALTSQHQSDLRYKDGIHNAYAQCVRGNAGRTVLRDVIGNGTSEMVTGILDDIFNTSKDPKASQALHDKLNKHVEEFKAKVDQFGPVDCDKSVTNSSDLTRQERDQIVASGGN